MKSKTIPIYVGLVILLAAFAAAQLDWGTVLDLTPGDWLGFVVFVLLGLLADYLSLPLVVGRSQSTQSIIFILLFACVLVLGPAAATLAAAVNSTLAQLFVHRRGSLRTVFNIAQNTLAASLGGLAYASLGGVPDSSALSFQVVPFLAFGVTVTAANTVAVSGVISLDQRLGFGEVFRRLLGRRGINVLPDLLVAPLAVIIAIVYVRLGAVGLAGASFLLLWVRRSYHASYQLQQANRSLLKALVKAIETRDPYTSGHSMRVAALASRVAKGLNLPGRQIEDIETAALLHDVGKIDAIYSDILKKKGSLSKEEMEIIKSHVEKGVELLSSLSSFGSDIIASVRHHHERYDGSGYPDGISGLTIPLGARIIKMCDAVDAMLSDRPYRKALSIPDVREQLLIFSEREFDPQLVTVFLSGTVLEDHQTEIREAHEAARQHEEAHEAAEPRLTLTG